MRLSLAISLILLTQTSFAGCFDTLFKFLRTNQTTHSSVVQSLHTGVSASVLIGEKQMNVTVVDVNYSKIKVQNLDNQKTFWVKSKAFQNIKIRAKSTSNKGLREKQWAQFEELQEKLWEQNQSYFRLQVADFKKLSKEEQQFELSRLDEALQTIIEEKFNTTRAGIHFNLNGGSALQYMQGGGIRHGRGDIGNQYGNINFDELVYFFRSNEAGILKPISEPNPKQLVGGRYGDTLILFNLDSPAMQSLHERGVITKETAINMTFDEKLTKNHIGIPSEAFIVPPIRVFRPFSMRLNRVEETYLNLRWLIILLEKSNMRS